MAYLELSKAPTW